MAIHTAISPAEAADRLAIRELFDAYAHCADRRDAEGQKALFTSDTRFAVYMSGPDTDPTYVLDGREALTPVFEALNQYQATARRITSPDEDFWRSSMTPSHPVLVGRAARRPL